MAKHEVVMQKDLEELFINVKKPPYPLVAMKGDNVTDDSIAFNALTTYALQNNKRLYIPFGSYKCLAQDISVSCDIVGQGDKTIIYGKVRVNAPCSLRDFKLIANKNGDTLYVAGNISSRLDRVIIDNVSFDCLASTDVSFRHSIQANYVNKLEIKNCNIKYGINLTSCSDFNVSGNVIDGDNFQNNTELLHITYKSSGAVEGNTFLNTGDNFIDLYSSGDRVVINGNRFIGCKSKFNQGIEIKVSLSDDVNNTSSDTNGWSESIIITNNVMQKFYPDGNRGFQGIQIYYVDNRSTQTFSWANTPRNMIIKGNIIEGYDESNGSITAASFTGISIKNSWGILIDSNIIRDVQSKVAGNLTTCGIAIHDCHDINITNNKIAVQNAVGINFYRDCYGINVNGNIIGVDENKGTTVKRGIHFAKFGSDTTICTASKFNITNNIITALDHCIMADYPSSSLVEFNISSNQFKTGVLYIPTLSKSNMIGNNLDVTLAGFAGVYLGRDDGVQLGSNIVIGNRVKTVNQNAFYIYNQEGSIFDGNILDSNATAYNLRGTSRNNIIKNTFCTNHSSTNIVLFVTVSAPDQATFILESNVKIS